MTALREYVTILRQLSENGRAEFDGEYYRVRDRTAGPLQVPLLISALRSRAYALAGEVADGVITWVTPRPYIQQTGIPALQQGAAAAGRPAPPVVVHVAVALTDDAAAAYTAMKRQLGIYPRIAEYARMFRTVGFENPGGEFEDGLLRELVIHGSEAEVRAALDGIAADGVTEVLASLLDTGSGVDGALAVLGAYCRDRGTSGSVAGTAGTGVS